MATLQSLVHLEAREPGGDLLRVVIETPKAGRNKFKFDEKIGYFTVNKMLPLGASFPYDFGFIPSTRGEDGDPLDILVLMDEPAFPGCVVPARLIGVIEANQTAKGRTIRNDRLIAFLETPYNRPEVQSLEEWSASRVAELEHFFISYNRMEGREFQPIGRYGPGRAEELLEKGMRRFKDEKR
jgi:inorganic pyrophosphatase